MESSRSASAADRACPRLGAAGVERGEKNLLFAPNQPASDVGAKGSRTGPLPWRQTPNARTHAAKAMVGDSTGPMQVCQSRACLASASAVMRSVISTSTIFAWSAAAIASGSTVVWRGVWSGHLASAGRRAARVAAQVFTSAHSVHTGTASVQLRARGDKVRCQDHADVREDGRGSALGTDRFGRHRAEAHRTGPARPGLVHTGRGLPRSARAGRIVRAGVRRTALVRHSRRAARGSADRRGVPRHPGTVARCAGHRRSGGRQARALRKADGDDRCRVR